MEKLTLFSFFKFKLALPMLTLFTIISSLWSTALISIINNKISGAPMPFFEGYDWQIFVFVALTSFLFTYYFKLHIVKITLNFGKDMMLKIINTLRLSDYESYLRLGEAKIRTAMEDIGTLEDIPETFISLLNALVMAIVTIAYMFYLYPPGAFMIIGIVVVLSSIYAYTSSIIEKNMDEERDLEDSFMDNYNDFIHGFNKIKMSTKRSNSIFFDFMKKNREKGVSLMIKSQKAALGNDVLGEFSFNLLIASILFIMPVVFTVDRGVISGFMFAVLFLIGPITALIGLIPGVIAFNIAISRLNKFTEITTSKFNYEKLSKDLTDDLGSFEKLTINEVTYEYLDEKEDKISFTLQPASLEVSKGEVIFIYGGNGSGKSTFINILSGLCLQKTGEIFFNDTLITNENRKFYRNKLSCIFSNNYLFSENYDGFDLTESNEEFVELLKEMKLDEVIRKNEEENKVHQDLSSGQKKRLALIYSLLEDKDIFVFDEWAAEQDPEFRKYFYQNIIPGLKNKGKTVIAITHDDAYYQYCDRLIKFDYGHMHEIEEKLLGVHSF
ncbi:ATP-binding cassette domain-containing protein [Tenacibaculum xiamenense]|uniref:ATP-binding cassette domain-containing protein n=1 Tax=Tenacibaculum xiamenense TaxID=1261553 RepID=UPI003893D218